MSKSPLVDIACLVLDSCERVLLLRPPGGEIWGLPWKSVEKGVPWRETAIASLESKLGITVRFEEDYRPYVFEVITESPLPAAMDSAQYPPVGGVQSRFSHVDTFHSLVLVCECYFEGGELRPFIEGLEMKFFSIEELADVLIPEELKCALVSFGRFPIGLDNEGS